MAGEPSKSAYQPHSPLTTAVSELGSKNEATVVNAMMVLLQVIEKDPCESLDAYWTHETIRDVLPSFAHFFSELITKALNDKAFSDKQTINKLAMAFRTLPCLLSGMWLKELWVSCFSTRSKFFEKVR
jgi:hypothetical protein